MILYGAGVHYMIYYIGTGVYYMIYYAGGGYTI